MKLLFLLTSAIDINSEIPSDNLSTSTSIRLYIFIFMIFILSVYLMGIILTCLEMLINPQLEPSITRVVSVNSPVQTQKKQIDLKINKLALN